MEPTIVRQARLLEEAYEALKAVSQYFAVQDKARDLLWEKDAGTGKVPALHTKVNRATMHLDSYLWGLGGDTPMPVPDNPLSADQIRNIQASGA